MHNTRFETQKAFDTMYLKTKTEQNDMLASFGEVKKHKDDGERAHKNVSECSRFIFFTFF